MPAANPPSSTPRQQPTSVPVRLLNRIAETDTPLHRLEKPKRNDQPVFLGKRDQSVEHPQYRRSQAGAHPAARQRLPSLKALALPFSPLTPLATATAAAATPAQATQNTDLSMTTPMTTKTKTKTRTTPNTPAAAEHSFASAAEDYLEGVAESDRTLLNTKEFVFFSYFQRIRDSLDHAWRPLLQARLLTYFQSGRGLASDQSHSTRILVVLNPQGVITNVQVLSESGLHELDESAVAAFNRAGPFPNPPQGLLERDQKVRIPWEFILRT